MYRALYKKVDRSTLEGGVTIPKDLMKDFRAGKKMELPSARKVNVKWGKKRYECTLRYARPNNPYMILRYDFNRELLKRLRETFIYSYVVFKSQKEKSDKDKKSKQFRSGNRRGDREVVIFQPLNSKEIKLDVFIKIEDDWNDLFQRLANENVFGWIFNKESKYLITESSSWKSVKEYAKFKHKTNVIYYLAHTARKLLYIGKADILGQRVFPKRDHQGMPKDWDKFRFDVVKPEFSSLLERIEDHTIRSFAAILQNNKKYPSLNISQYTLVNSMWKKL